MFPPSPFASARGSFRVPVQAPGVDPGACPLVRVEFSEAWLPYILGALDQLVLQATWRGSVDVQTQAQQEAMYLKQLFAGALRIPCGGLPEEPGSCCGDCDMGCCSLRFNNGKLQCFCGGVWTDVDGQPAGGFLTGQPGAGSPQPSGGGGQQDYCFTLQAGQMVFLPTHVTAGDTLFVVVDTGAWQDGVNPLWRCPNGYLFETGACFTDTQLSGTDPLPTAPHMQIIGKIGSTYYDVYSRTTSGQPSVFTVPSGIADAPVVFLANNAAANGGNGVIQFCVRVTNNQPATWSADLKFVIAPNGFQPALGIPDGLPRSIWISGEGWHYVYNVSGGGNSEDRVFNPIHGTTITQLLLTGNTTGTASVQLEDGDNGVIATILQSGSVSGSGWSMLWTGFHTLTNGIRLDAVTVGADNPTDFVTLHVEGTGVNPFA